MNCSLKARRVFTPVGHDGVMWFMVFAVPMMSLFGIVGNIMSFIILKNSSSTIPSHLYLVCLALFDTLSLFSFSYSFYSNLNLQPILLKFTDQVTFIERYFSTHIACPWRVYTSFSMRLISIWTIVVFSLDRFIIIRYPFQSKSISSIRHTRITIAVVVIASWIVNLPWLFSFDRIPLCDGRTLCKGNKVLTYTRMIEFFFYSIIPSIIICLCNIYIVVQLNRRSRSSLLYSKKDGMSKQEKQITKRLLIVSTVFIVLTFPSLIIISIHSIDQLNHDRSYKSGIKADIFHLSMFLFVSNLSTNFILYCLTGSQFRKAAWSLLCCNIKEMRRYRDAILMNESSDAQNQSNNQTNSSNLSNTDNSNKGNISRINSVGTADRSSLMPSVLSHNTSLQSNQSTLPLLVTPL